MIEIPETVWAEAKEIFSEEIRDFGSSEYAVLNVHDVKEAIARAIMAERLRCAEIAKSWGETAKKVGQVIEADIAADIASCIKDSNVK